MNEKSNGLYLFVCVLIFLAGVAWSAKVFSASFVNIVSALCNTFLVFLAFKALNSWFKQKSKEQELNLLGDVVSYYHVYCDLFTFYSEFKKEINRINRSTEMHETAFREISLLDSELENGIKYLNVAQMEELYSKRKSFKRNLLNLHQQKTLKEKTAKLQLDYEKIKEHIIKCEQNMFKSSAQLLQRREINSLVESIIYPRKDYISNNEFEIFYSRINNVYRELQSLFFNAPPINLSHPIKA